MPTSSLSRFWRDESLPFIEAREVLDGRKVCYARHSHDTFSIGAITAGRSTYLNGHHLMHIAQGDVVLMNPQAVHACNPIENEPWAYRMFYVDTAWLGQLQHELGADVAAGFSAFAVTHTGDTVLYRALNQLYDMLTDPDADTLHRHSSAIEFFTLLQQRLGPKSLTLPAQPLESLQRAARFIGEHCTEALRLDDICLAANLSPSYLIRAFKQHYGMTPHAYLINRRIQRSRQWLKEGRGLAEVAAAAGFSDQAHFQRMFKKHLAATPGHYQG
ncbi:transcriptional regulator, AraC family [Pseudomonas duriflava]|uniref:Transcriptional regulator, AraC family n=1 Tax=Pseudomonas duriflava TaxID=459528 RepID=A0A562QFX8_9PSED|nr:AraC family transcriptional regulator [Pseudomonas duriflava]TWI55667.1 transcriptional regulator, AraC family [Pseudomonas duriflava]